MAEPLPAIRRELLLGILEQLRHAREAIQELLAHATSADAARRLRHQRSEIDRVMRVFGSRAIGAAGEAAAQATGLAGMAASGPGPAIRLNPRTLLATRLMLTDRITNTSQQAVRQIHSALTQHLLGVRSLSETITEIQTILDGAPRRRAMTIAYTEISRVYNATYYEALLERARRTPGLKKRWVHSDKATGRPGHVHAARQAPIPVDEPFELFDPRTGTVELLRFPGDPNASPGNTINCGCTIEAVEPDLDDLFAGPIGPIVQPGERRGSGHLADMPGLTAALAGEVSRSGPGTGVLAELATAGLIRRFVRQATGAGAKQPMLVLTEQLPGRVEQGLAALDIRPRARRLALDHDNVRHLLARHGTRAELLRGQAPMSAEDLVRLEGLLGDAEWVGMGQPPRAPDGATLVEIRTQDGEFEYTFVMKVRRRELVPYTAWKRPRKR